jgi:acyl-CoA synthetase (AMP-forming)/AMP-acid ligase II
MPQKFSVQDTSARRGVWEVLCSRRAGGGASGLATCDCSFFGDWFRTGDVGHLDAEGFLYLTDGQNDLIISGGENIASSEVERVVYELPQVKDAAVIGVPGLIVRGPRKIFDSSLANMGMLYAKRHGAFRAYHDRVFERFWKRELDIESPAALTAVLAECGADPGGFAAFLERAGRRELEEIMRAAEDAGVFGVPSFLLDDGDLYWGREHLPRIRALLTAAM